MRQRKPVVKKTSNNHTQKNAFFNPEGREWVKRKSNLWKQSFSRFVWSRRSVSLGNSKTVSTPLVRKTALELTAGKEAVIATRSIINFVSTKIKLVNTGLQTVNKFYNSQTADDVIKTRQIPTFDNGGGPIIGCQTVTAVVAALLKNARPKSGKISDIKIVRTICPWGKRMGSDKLMGVPHSLVSLKINGAQHYIDAFSGRSLFGSKKLVKESEVASQILKLKSSGKWKERKDASQFGIDTFKDFLEESRQNGADIAANLDLTQLK